MNLAIDLDGVLCNVIQPLQERLDSEFGVEIPMKELDKFDLADTLKEHNIPSTWLFKCFKDPWFWAKATPYSENVETVNRWNKEGHDIHIVTGRTNDVRITTAAWLKRIGVSYKNLEFHPIMKKYEYMKANDCPVIFEDRFFEANKAASFGFRAFVVRRPWNKDYESRITNSLLSYIDELSDADSFLESYGEFI